MHPTNIQVIPFFTEASVIATAKAIGAIFEFLATDEGQLQCKEWREDRAKFKQDLISIGGWFKGLGK